MSRFIAASAALILATNAIAAPPTVKLGIDVLVEQDFAPVAGLRVGLITNPTGVTADLRATVDVLHQTDKCKLVALFGPEHGVRGNYAAGDKVEDATDADTGLPAYSLYGANRKPTAEMLADIDAIAFDIQDIGSRSYTYISTMAAAMESAAEHGKKFVVLDRPNPLNGNRIEGRPLDLTYKSFVGYLPVPYVHGMTVGEMAKMINEEGWLPDGAKCDLVVVPMKGWKRAMHFDDTGLTWVPTSPHVPRADTSLYYAATGIMGELHAVNEGVGYPLPFELAGKPGISAQKLADALNSRKLAGVSFRPMYYQPYYGTYKTETCGGVQILFTDRSSVHLTSIQFYVMDAIKKLDGGKDLQLFGGKRDNMFDKVCGTDQIRKAIAAGEPVEKVLDLWNEGAEDFREARKKYLLYE